MCKVVGVKFRDAGKVYHFETGDLTVSQGDQVIVETSRGLEFGTVSTEETMIDKGNLNSPLKKILRMATEQDVDKHEKNLAKRDEAMRLCKEKIQEHGLEMKLIDAEYTFDNNKIVFYFTADGRVDFRELVKDLASVFRMRIELRQIGVRDEAKMLGGVGNCGRGLCCHTWLADFEPVSIKMAKVQNLSLNPTKISGICGRLMCCLKYENDIYATLKKGMPNQGERVTTPDGTAVVVDTNILESTIKTRLVLEEEDEDNDNEEKLSTEFYIYDKEEIKRQGKKNVKKGKDKPKKKNTNENSRKNGKDKGKKPDKNEEEPIE